MYRGMDVPQIKDREHLEAWLKTRSREECIAIAHRAAMRVAPLWIGKIEFTVRPLELGLTEMACFRQLIVSGVASLVPSSRINDAAANSVSKSIYIADINNHIAYLAAWSTAAAAATAHASPDAPAPYAFAAGDTAYTVYAPANATIAMVTISAEMAITGANKAPTTATADDGKLGPPEVWEALWLDLNAVYENRDSLSAPTWQGATSPFVAEWFRGRADLVTRGENWDFWVRWYDAALRGEPLNWKMQEEIALLPSEVWEGDVAGLAAAIAKIETRYRLDEFIEANPYAIRVLVDQRSRKLIGMPLDSPNLEAILEAIRTALFDFTSRCKRDNSPNKYGIELLRLAGPVMSDLRRDLKRYRDNPLALFDALGDGCRELQETAKGAEIPNEGALFRLVGTIDRQALDIIGAAPSVLETVKRRNGVEFELLKRDQLAQAIRFCSGMQADSKDWLQTSAALAIQIVSDPSRSIGEKQAAWYFMKAVIPRGAKAKHDFEEAHPRKKSALQRAGEIADVAIKLDKGIDAGQEIYQEGAGWVTEIYTQIASGNLFGWNP